MDIVRKSQKFRVSVCVVAAVAGFAALAAKPAVTVTASQMAHVLGITSDPAIDPERNTKSPFLIDEFKIWDYAKTDFQ